MARGFPAMQPLDLEVHEIADKTLNPTILCSGVRQTCSFYFPTRIKQLRAENSDLTRRLETAYGEIRRLRGTCRSP
ncbi:hypothetical protein [Streptomyces bluensis]|uniref:hypothetical protein n=1 Tax=Streptomyces bluensis TaxID=33897 RepID=UPI0033308E98